jgi:hypothetical protein
MSVELLTFWLATIVDGGQPQQLNYFRTFCFPTRKYRGSIHEDGSFQDLNHPNRMRPEFDRL